MYGGRRTSRVSVVMRRTILLAALAATAAVPATAAAAPVKITRASAVSAAGVTTVQVSNPGNRVLTGTASIAAGGKTLASKSVRLGKWSARKVTIGVGAPGVSALREAGGRATIALRLRAGKAKPTTVRRTLTLALPTAAPTPAPAPADPAQPAQPQPSQPAQPDRPAQPAAPAPAQPVSTTWAGRMGTEGAYDDFEFTLDNGQITFTKWPFVPVFCMENGGLYRSAVSLEPFVVAGPWAVGTDASVQQSGIAGNQLVGSSSRTITYKVTDSAQAAGKVTGTLGMSFFDSKLDVFGGYKMIFINCAGSQSFEAVPA